MIWNVFVNTVQIIPGFLILWIQSKLSQDSWFCEYSSNYPRILDFVNTVQIIPGFLMQKILSPSESSEGGFQINFWTNLKCKRSSFQDGSILALSMLGYLKTRICWIFYRKIQLYSKNVCKKKFVQKMKNYTFLKSPWPCHFKYAKIFAQF